MSTLEVCRRDGIFCLIGHDGIARPIRLAGQPFASFLPGWRPRGACDGFPPWTILDLQHQSGQEASWLLDETLDHTPLTLPQLTQDDRARLAEQAREPIRDAHASLLCAPRPQARASLARFAGLNRADLAQLLRLAAPEGLDRTRVVGPEGFASTEGDGQPRLAAVAETLGGDLQAAIREALVTGSLTRPSPVDGRILHSRDSLVLHEHRLAYRFVDERHGLVFFIGTTHHVFAISDLYIPETNTVFTHWSSAGDLASLGQQFLVAAIADAPALLAYLEDPARRFAVAMRGHPNLHIGHQLWNELTALDQLVRSLPPEHLPRVVVPAPGQGSEAYAPIDRIFPELAGRVDRTLSDPRDLAGHVYRERLCLFRALDEHVTSGLSQRIRRASRERGVLSDDERLAARVRDERLPCILFGLRVENRTAIEPAGLIIDAIEHLHARCGPLVAVIDGHNARLHHDPVCLYNSFGQGGHRPPIFDELQIGLQLHQRFDGSAVELVNLCGASMARSLFWTERADFFVAFWGAGLAKYRWACNRPGLVLSSRWNLRHRTDLDIYHAPRFQQDGAPIRFIDPEAVTDLPEAPVLFSPINPVPTYSNFQVAPAALRTALDTMIAEHLDRGPTS